MVIIMFEIAFFLLGFGLSIIGFIYIITYLNYLTIGYSWIQYIHIIVTKLECLLSLIGLGIILIIISKKR